MLNLPGIGAFKPDFTVVPLEGQADIMRFNRERDENGVIWESGDYNGDGLNDVTMWTNDAKQVFYMVQ